MSKYSLISFDMDGTLLNSDKELTEEVSAALKEAGDKGKIISLSTGRCMSELTSFISKLSCIKYVIAVSGALVLEVESNKVIYSCTIDENIIKTVFERIKGRDVMVQIQSDMSIIQKDKTLILDHYQMAQYQRAIKTSTINPDDIEEYYLTKLPPVYKFNIYSTDTEARKEVENLLKDLPLSTAYSERTSLELSKLGTTKGKGLLRLCDYLNIDVKNTIAVGDADNDLDILKTAGLAVAMGNANDNVMAVADVIVADNNNGGCAEAIHRYLL